MLQMFLPLLLLLSILLLDILYNLLQALANDSIVHKNASNVGRSFWTSPTPSPTNDDFFVRLDCHNHGCNDHNSPQSQSKHVDMSYYVLRSDALF